MLVLASLVLGFAMFGALSGFGVMWLHSMPMRPCLDVTIWEVSPWCRLLRAHLSLFSLRATIAYRAFLCHPLALCASLHACLHIHAWVLLVSVSSMLQHNKAMDIRSKPIFIPHGHYLLFACLFTLCLLLLSCLSTPLLICLLTSCMLCLSLLSCLLVLHPFAIIYAFLPFHCSFTGFLSLPLHVHMERGHMELGSDLLGASKKGMDASLPTWIERLCSIGLGFSFSLWLCTLFNPFFPPPFLP